ncbi:MAG: hypothetical protein J0I06_11660 [Planctomycetes bacterium]|nr:hypothetical protein [Planctomycetota bacterium]
MASVPPEKLVATYNRGMITGHELVLRLIEAATQYPPEEILPLVPEELVAELKQRGTNPPDRPEAVRTVQAGCYAGPHDPQAWERKEREDRAAYYEGVWRWHEFWAEQR